MGFLCGSSGKEPTANAGDVRNRSSIPKSGRFPGGGHESPLQYSCLENPMDRGTWWAIVYRGAKSRTWLKQLSTLARSKVLWSDTLVMWASLAAQTIKNLPAMLETPVRSMGWEDPLEKRMATYSSILAWRIPWTEEPCRLQSTGLQRTGHNWVTHTDYW